MRWDPGHSSSDVEDRRGQRFGGGGGGIGGLLFGLLPFLIRSPIGWLILIVGGGVWLCTSLGRGPFGGAPDATGGGPRSVASTTNDESKAFVAFVLDDAQDTWTKKFSDSGETYQRAKLVLFTDRTPTACGNGAAAMGPFYCPRDQRVYIDLSFYRDLEDKLGAGGDFAKAYVIAHEIGHHVQHQLGITDKVQKLGNGKGDGSQSVRLELQADCFAGMWAHATSERKLLESGDIEEALDAAAAIGDDRLQKKSSGTVTPETWTHGSSAQRARWFKNGYETGKMESCDTFAAATL